MSKIEIPEFKFAIREDLSDTKDLFLPKRATPGAAAWDVRAAQRDRAKITLGIGDCVKIPLGFRTFCPEGWWFELNPRSSTFGKKNLHCLYGIIDSDFEGELVLSCQYIPPESFRDQKWKELQIEFGEAIGQMIPVKLQEMQVTRVSNEEIDELYKNRAGVRGAGGFGSTSK